MLLSLVPVQAFECGKMEIANQAAELVLWPNALLVRRGFCQVLLSVSDMRRFTLQALGRGVWDRSQARTILRFIECCEMAEEVISASAV